MLGHQTTTPSEPHFLPAVLTLQKMPLEPPDQPTGKLPRDVQGGVHLGIVLEADVRHVVSLARGHGVTPG
jgi:hypothetical protein